MVPEKKQTVRSALMIVLICLSLRAPLGTVGPLSGQFQQDLGLSAFAAGFVTTIPMIAFSAMAPVAGRIAVAMKCKTLMTGCFGISALGLLLRSFGGVVGLYGGTLLVGLAVGTMNVLMPALIRRQFPERIGLMMGCYLTAQTAAAALFSGQCQALSAALGGWRMGMASPVVLCLLSVVICLLSGRLLDVRLQSDRTDAGVRITWKHMAVALYMGSQSFAYFSLLAWLPTIAEALSEVRGDSGMLLLVMQGCGMVLCLIMPIVTQRFRRRGLLAGCGAMGFVVGFLMMLLGGSSYTMIVLGTALCGCAGSAVLSISLTLIAEQGRNAAETARISAMSNCIGYALAAFGPTGLGLLFDVFGSWQMVLQCLLALSVGMTLLGLYAGKREKIETAVRRA